MAKPIVHCFFLLVIIREVITSLPEELKEFEVERHQDWTRT